MDADRSKEWLYNVCLKIHLDNLLQKGQMVIEEFQERSTRMKEVGQGTCVPQFKKLVRNKLSFVAQTQEDIFK